MNNFVAKRLLLNMRLLFSLVLFCMVAGNPLIGFPQAKKYAGTKRDTVAHILPEILQDSLWRDTLTPVVLPSLQKFKDEKLNTPIVYLPDSLIRDTLRYEFVRIKNIAYKNRWTKELYKLVFVNPFPGQVNVMRTQNSEERFKDYQGKTIKNISIKVLPPYGTSVYDTTYYEDDLGWVRNLANKTHMKTAEKVILKQLTIKPGMQLQPFELVQNEILLRRLDYLEDATIIVSEVDDHPSEVEIVIICKDKLSWGANIESNFINSFNIGLENKNFMKLGHVVNYEFSYRGTKDKKWGNILSYDINSIWGTHIDVRGYYRNDYREKIVKVDVERPFLTSMMKWAGGISAGRVFYSDDLPDRNVSHLETLFDYHFQDVWGGRSFQLKPLYSYNRNIYLTARFFTTLFNNRPQVSSDSNHFYYNRFNYFWAITYTKIKYYKANLIYDFGRTEDIPTGLYSTFQAGVEKSEFENYGYLGTVYHYSHFNKQTERYYSVQAALSSYLNKDGFQRGFLKLGAGHISNLCSIGDYRFRFYNDIEYIRGIRRYPDDYLYMRDYDIRGFQSDSLRGNQKLSASLSGTLFFPYVRKGFRFSMSAFVDGGAIAQLNQSLSKSKTYWGLGMSFNIRNDNVVIKNIRIRLAWYPTIPVDGRSVQAILSSGKEVGFYDYQVNKPQMVPYE